MTLVLVFQTMLNESMNYHTRLRCDKEQKIKKEYGELAYQEVEKMFDELVDNQLNVKK